MALPSIPQQPAWRTQRPDALPFPTPDYALMELLVERLLENIRVASDMIATSKDDVAIMAVLRAGDAAHERLARAMQTDALNVHAAGQIFAVLHGDRLTALRKLAFDKRNAGAASNESRQGADSQ
jgi:hypothetical protein